MQNLILHPVSLTTQHLEQKLWILLYQPYHPGIPIFVSWAQLAPWICHICVRKWVSHLTNFYDVWPAILQKELRNYSNTIHRNPPSSSSIDSLTRLGKMWEREVSYERAGDHPGWTIDNTETPVDAALHPSPPSRLLAPEIGFFGNDRFSSGRIEAHRRWVFMFADWINVQIGSGLSQNGVLTSPRRYNVARLKIE